MARTRDRRPTGVDAELIVVRHARSEIPRASGPNEYGRPLSAAGTEQAGQLVTELVGYRPRSVVSSPYRRAVDTVRPAAARLGLPVCVVDDLREWDSGLDPTPDWEQHFAASWADPAGRRAGGESLDDLTARAVGQIRRLARTGLSPILIGSHGTFICRALVGLGFTAVDWPFSLRMPMPAVYRLQFSGGRVRAAGPGFADTV